MLQVNSIFSDEGLGQYCALDYQVNYLKEMLCFVPVSVRAIQVQVKLCYHILKVTKVCSIILQVGSDKQRVHQGLLCIGFSLVEIIF